MRTAGELPQDDNGKSWWANELHPTPPGFRRIAFNSLRAPMIEAGL